VADTTSERIDWRALWKTGGLARFCFVSLGILLHATNETMIATIMPAMVRDLSGVELVGWSLAIYELGAIVAGASAGRLISYVSLRSNMSVAAFIFAIGAVICATATYMPVFLVGRLIQGLGGGALVSLAFISIERLYPPRIWPQLYGVLSAVWGVAAFSGPLVGAVIAEHLSWRWAFGCFACLAVLMGMAALQVLRKASGNANAVQTPPPFPYLPLATLAVAILFIASAGVAIDPVRSPILLLVGLGGLVLFLWLDSRAGASRLFPSRLFDWRTRLGSGMTMIASLTVACCALTVYGPLLLSTLHHVPVLTTGYIIAAESISWSIFSILVANARPQHERFLIVLGGIVITAGLIGFAIVIPIGNIPLIALCALAQGGGFGIAWPFLTRVIISSAKAGENSIAASAVPTMQRIGYAVGAALCGIVANASGFDGGLTIEAANDVAFWVFAAFIPLALFGCVASLRTLSIKVGPVA
jgi:MFS family permease